MQDDVTSRLKSNTQVHYFKGVGILALGLAAFTYSCGYAKARNDIKHSVNEDKPSVLELRCSVPLKDAPERQIILDGKTYRLAVTYANEKIDCTVK